MYCTVYDEIYSSYCYSMMFKSKLTEDAWDKPADDWSTESPAADVDELVCTTKNRHHSHQQRQ